MKETIYFISMTTENALCVLQRIASVFSRHRINIEQMNVFETANKGVSHFSLVLHSNEEKIQKVVKQLDKVIEVMDITISNRIQMSDVAKETEKMKTLKAVA
ncbi:acetolactate synthase small subunit [Fangia hongkongensis]|uniref:acetolactate synthase small subunit n=1 Tax=Fangia hongkongensis TaxID=270495 RepID=UPI0003664BFB|nr:acetolactate synthase small subunit [Fangia hongkongensis]MBK2125913.1 acetolactate synthase small subunit [Fangia hongkongensis]